ncbi:MAG: glycosyltransferase family 2 protein [SAR324 cluster bacterium]|nr:glycosyltransferase family 2 protein [SAR324 cluster bacterium]
MKSSTKLISIVAPVFCEEIIIEETYRQLTGVLQAMDHYQYELIFVNDGSTDQTHSILKKIAERDHHLKVISFSRNFGHQMAITAGIEKARGHAVITIDSDLQDPPALIPQMIELWEAGNEVVYAKRTERQGETYFKKISAVFFYKFLNYLSNIEIPENTGDFRLLDRKVVDVINNLEEHNRFIRGLVSWVGYRQVAIEYVRQPRLAGKSKYSLGKMLRFAIDALLSFSNKPLRLALNLGFFSIVIAFLVLIYGLVMHWVGNTIRGWTSTLVTILFLGGVQLFTVGIIGEYLSRMYDDLKGRPLYVIDEELNFDSSAGEENINQQP